MEKSEKKQILNDVIQAIKYSEKQQRQKALVIFNNYLKNLPDDAEINFQFGQLCNSLNEPGLAISHLFTAVNLEPENINYLGILGDTLLNNKQYAEADKQLRKAIEFSPNNWQLLASLGAANAALEIHNDAIEYLKKSLSLKPSQPRANENLSVCMLKLDRYDEAIEYAKVAIKLDPQSFNAYNIMGYILTNTGKTPEAIRHLEKAIQINRFQPDSYVNLTRAKKFSPKDKSLINKIEKILETSMPALNRAHFNFALGKMYDDCAEWDKAYVHYKQANLLAKPQYHENKLPPKFFKSLKTVFTKDLFDKVRPLGNQSELPVFIVGMPRSGTSLIEQIISSHPEANGAGELVEMGLIADSIANWDDPRNYNEKWTAILNQQSLNELSEKYLAVLTKDRKQASRITDKLPDNYLNLGLITILFPNAKIIHIARSPLDICVSNYFHIFTDQKMGWSYDPQWIINRFKMYRSVIEFWKSVLPEDKIFEIHYEDLIANPEQNIRKLVKYCGLKWNPVCLDFYKSDNIVKTASVSQVRQPIYKSSMKRWVKYGNYIEEFAAGLEKYLDDSDKQQLNELGIKIKSKRWLFF